MPADAYFIKSSRENSSGKIATYRIFFLFHTQNNHRSEFWKNFGESIFMSKKFNNLLNDVMDFVRAACTVVYLVMQAQAQYYIYGEEKFNNLLNNV